MTGAARRGKGQAAGLGAQATVSAAPSQKGAESALSRNRHTQRPVDKAFQFHGAALMNLPDFFQRKLPGQYHPVGSQLPQQFRSRRSVKAHLRGSVQRQFRSPAPQQSKQAHILHQHGIHRQGA